MRANPTAPHLEPHIGGSGHVAVITLPLAGHLNPMGVVVEALRARGHRVTVVGPAGLCDLARIHMPGVATYTISDSAYPPDRLQGFIDGLPDVRGLRGIRRVIREIAALSDLYGRQLPEAFSALGIQGVVYDQLEPMAGLIARATGLPHASVACALPMNREAHLPPPYLGWPLSTSPLWRSLYGGADIVTDRLMAPQERVLEAAARRHGLPPRPGGPSAWVSEACDLSQCIPGFDYPRTSALQHVGPLRRDDPLSPLDFERDGRDLVFCSLGTLMGGRLDIFTAVAEACAANVVQCVIAHGGRLSEDQERYLASLPGQPVVRDFVDQQSVLGEATAAVLHGGFNSVLDALSAAVPMVVLPLAFEQAAIAARVRRAGAGVVVKGRSAKAVRKGLETVLNSRSHRAAAHALGAASHKAGGVREAVAGIEAALALTPVSSTPQSARRELPSF